MSKVKCLLLLTELPITIFSKINLLLKSMRSEGNGLSRTFKLVTRFGLPQVWNTESCIFDSLASNNCFSNRNVFQMGSTLDQKSYEKKKKPYFWSKSSKFRVVRPIRFCSNFIGMWYKYFFLRNVWRDFRLPMSAVATLTRKNLNDKFTLIN